MTETTIRDPMGSVQRLRRGIEWDKDDLRAILARWQAEKLPGMRSYYRLRARYRIARIRAAEANIRTWERTNG